MPDDTLLEWVNNMLSQELKQARGTIENERAWRDGAPDAASRAAHEANIALNERYIRILDNMLNNSESFIID